MKRIEIQYTIPYSPQSQQNFVAERMNTPFMNKVRTKLVQPLPKEIWKSNVLTILRIFGRAVVLFSQNKSEPPSKSLSMV